MKYLVSKTFKWRGSGLPVFEAIKNMRGVFFLDSSLCANKQGRYSFLGFEPFHTLSGNGGGCNFNGLREQLIRYGHGGTGGGFPFSGGAVGYFSYDLGFCLEEVKQRAKDDLRLPRLFFNLYDTVIAIDNLEKKLVIFSSGLPEKRYLLAKKKARERLKQFIDVLSGAMCRVRAPVRPGNEKAFEVSSNFTKRKYLESVAAAKNYIKSGDVYQVNLSQRFCARNESGAPELYASLRRASPSSFSAYMDCGEFQIISSSPERFLCFDGRKVTTRPMKGTRPRGESKKDDVLLKRQLEKSAKDKAELTMIVDLLRNDLGRVCEYGSIRVKSLRKIEAYSTVYQTTATIEGLLHRDKDRVDLVKACFPGGSITGCPKIRSMQIIEELEPTKRGIYTGSLGYFSFHNTMDLSVLIRTILKKNHRIYFQVGGGIVADSRAENEYEETLIKAKGIFKAIGAASTGCYL